MSHKPAPLLNKKLLFANGEAAKNKHSKNILNMKKNIFLLAAAAIGFVSCQKSVDYGKLSSNFVVSTNRDQGAAFNSYKTYYISDTVINLGGTGKDSILIGGNAQVLVDKVKANMTSRGYNFVG